MQGPPPNVYVCWDCFVPCIQIIPDSPHPDRDSTPSQVCNLIPCAPAHWQKWDRDTASATDLLMLAETLQNLISPGRRGPPGRGRRREDGGNPPHRRRAGPGRPPCDGCDWWSGCFCECPPARPCPREEAP